MRFTYVLAAAVTAGGLALMAGAPASAAPAAAATVSTINIANAQIQDVAWRRRVVVRRHYGPRARVYVRPRARVVVRPFARRCWINRYGYRVCR